MSDLPALRVDLKTGDAWLSAERLFLPGRLNHTLLVLAATPGRVVPARRIAPDGTYVGGENHNASCMIWRLRKVLGDSAIRTWPGHGYVLMLPVEHIKQ